MKLNWNFLGEGGGAKQKPFCAGGGGGVGEFGYFLELYNFIKLLLLQVN